MGTRELRLDKKQKEFLVAAEYSDIKNQRNKPYIRDNKSATRSSVNYPQTRISRDRLAMLQDLATDHLEVCATEESMLEEERHCKSVKLIAT